MSLDIGDALSEGFDRTLSRNGLLLTAVFVVFGLVNAVIQQSYNRVQYEQIDVAEFLAEFEGSPLFDGLPFNEAEFQDLMEQSIQQATPLSYLDGLSLPVLFLLTILLAFVAEAIRIVAVRVFASDETDDVPGDLATRNLAWATLNGVVGGIVVLVLGFLGLFLLVIPGLFLFVVFYFVRQEIAVEGTNFIDAMTDSWALTKGSRFEVFALGAILVLLGVGVSFVSDVFVVAGPAVASVVNVVLQGFVIAFSVASVARAYVQLKSEPTESEGDDLDQYMDEDLDPV